jgi:hypothetical protein
VTAAALPCCPAVVPTIRKRLLTSPSSRAQQPLLLPRSPARPSVRPPASDCLGSPRLGAPAALFLDRPPKPSNCLSCDDSTASAAAPSARVCTRPFVPPDPPVRQPASRLSFWPLFSSTSLFSLAPSLRLLAAFRCALPSTPSSDIPLVLFFSIALTHSHTRTHADALTTALTGSHSHPALPRSRPSAQHTLATASQRLVSN